MSKVFCDNFRFDFGDDDSGIYWDAWVTINTEYDSVESYRMGLVHVGGKALTWDKVDEDLKNKIRERMNSVEMADFIS